MAGDRGDHTTVESYSVIETSLEPLVALEQWVCWVYVERSDANGEPYLTKVPIDPRTGERARVNDSSTWATFEKARHTERDDDDLAGIGFVFSDDSEVYGIDWDDVYDPVEHTWVLAARDYIEDIGSYTEFSPSGTGAHMILVGEKPGELCRTDISAGGKIEIYETGRFFTVTGDRLSSMPATVERTPAVFEEIYAEIFDVSAVDDIHSSVREQLAHSVTTGDTDRTANLDDSTIIEMARDAKNGNDFAALYDGSTAGYPSHSEARMALLFHLAFWTEKDEDQMDRLYRESKLHCGGHAEKWERVGTTEIEKAVTKTTETYTPPADDPIPDMTPDEAQAAATKAARESMTALEAANETIDSGSQLSAREDDIIMSFAEDNKRALYIINEHGGFTHISGMLSRESAFFTKTEVKRRLRKVVSSYSPPDAKTPFDEVIDDRLQSVLVTRTTDSTQDTTYQWRFDTFTIETGPEKNTRPHFNWHTFRNEFHDASGDYPAPPHPMYMDMDDWQEYIVSVIDRRGIEDTTTGPRTSAVDSLKNEISHSNGYGTLAAATTRNGVYLDDDLSNATELWIPNSRTNKVCEEKDVTPRALQAELTDRGHTIDSRNGVSISTMVNNDHITFWVLDPDFQRPQSYTKDPMEEQHDEPSRDLDGGAVEYGLFEDTHDE